MKQPLLLMSAAVVAVLWLQAVHADISISNKPTQNMNCNAGVCMPTAKNAVLNVGDITNMLAAGDLTVQSGNGDGTAAAITIVDGFSWTNQKRLTLTAKKNITVKAPLTVAGTGALTINYNVGQTGGDLSFVKKGKIDFRDVKSSLVINGNHYQLVASVAGLAHKERRNPEGYFALANDYDASPDGTYVRAPILAAYGSTLDGLGHAISNLRIVDTAKNGRSLAFIAVNFGTVRDLSLTNEFVYQTGHGQSAGGLVGENYGGTVTRVHVDGTVQSPQSTGVSRVGGVVGYSVGGIISNTTASVDVQGNGMVGGLAGLGENNTGADPTVIGCHATGSVTAQLPNAVGGLVGAGFNIFFSSASGSVQSVGDHSPGELGGLTGDAGGGLIKQSYATGAVAGGYADHIGGLVAGSYQVEDSYSTGSVQGGEQAWIAGFSVQGQATRSYSIGPVQISNRRLRAPAKIYVSGFMVRAYRLSERDYWDVDTSGTDIGCGYHGKHCERVIGLTDAELKSGLPNGFKKDIWGQSSDINNGYPYLRANPPQ